MSNRKKYIESCQVSEVKTNSLNGYFQKVLFEGKNSTSPIIIYLHGGPGSPIPFCAGSRGLFPEITDRFIMVYWDQLGCGMNDYPIDDTFSIDSYTKMTVDLIKAVRNDFPENPINLFGVSWGSILAANAAVEVPELINRIVVYGQVMKNLFFNKEVFDTLEKAALSRKEKEKLEYLKTVDSIGQKEIMTIAGLIRSHTEGYQAKNGGKTPMGKILFGLLTSPDYTIKDFKAVAVNGTRKNQSLFQELIHLDLRSTLERITVPYLIMQGDTDIVTSTKYIESFVKESKNENLHFALVKNSGHMPSGDGMAYVIEKGFAFLCSAQ
ncbi:MAG: alpha/beta fold hydrolase [bacterium]|nr:alpha/beta fold hydrolase [bacterium]MCM1375083.1 alpha/beta fold hydrolase [Muribaculum sp.]